MLKVENHPSQEVKNSNWTQKNCKRNKNLDINMSRTNEIEKKLVEIHPKTQLFENIIKIDHHLTSTIKKTE